MDMKVKEEISKIVDSLPDEVLGRLLEYLKKIEESSVDKSLLALNLSKILQEDKQLLSDLAK